MLKNNNQICSIYGFAIVFNYLDKHMDVISDQAKISIAKNLIMKFDHKHIIGSWVTCSTNKYGLFVNGIIYKPNIHLMHDILLSKIGLSVGFYIKNFKWHYINNVKYRVIDDLQIVEISLTYNPANHLCGCMLINNNE